MTQDEIVELARQAGCPMANMMPMYFTDTQLLVMLKAFAKLVAEKEREFYMQLFLDPENQPTQFGTATQEYQEQEIRAEREACAKLIESYGSTLVNGFMLTEAIRARGNNK